MGAETLNHREEDIPDSFSSLGANLDWHSANAEEGGDLEEARMIAHFRHAVTDKLGSVYSINHTNENHGGLTVLGYHHNGSYGMTGYETFKGTAQRSDLDVDKVGERVAKHEKLHGSFHKIDPNHVFETEIQIEGFTSTAAHNTEEYGVSEASGTSDFDAYGQYQGVAKSVTRALGIASVDEMIAIRSSRERLQAFLARRQEERAANDGAYTKSQNAAA